MRISTTVNMKWDGSEVKKLSAEFAKETPYSIGLAIERQAKLLAAKNWGLLAASITTQGVDNGTELEDPGKYRVTNPYGYPEDLSPNERRIQRPNEENTALVGTAVYYAWYVEYGTQKMYAQPALRPAAEIVITGEVPEIMEFNGKKVFKDYLGGKGY